jgi:small subunit ribosomal protein S4e
MPTKARKWVVSPRPGPHKKFESIPLLIIVRDILKLADIGSDAKKIIKSKEIFVDGKPRLDHKYPVGLFDTIEVPKIDKQFRVIPSRKGLELIEISKQESKQKLCRIKGKTMTKNGIPQLNLHDGKNIVLDKKTKTDYNTGDSLLIELPDQKIIDHLKMDKGMVSIITDGQNRGTIAKIKEIIIRRTREPNKIICEKDGKDFEAIADYVFVVGKTKPEIKVSV